MRRLGDCSFSLGRSLANPRQGAGDNQFPTLDSPNPPKPILLNSFFLTDLAFAEELFLGKKTPRNLRRYLGLEAPTEAKNLIRDQESSRNRCVLKKLL